MTQATPGQFSVAINSHEMKNQTAACGIGIEAFGQRLEFDTTAMKLADDLNKMTDLAARPIKPPGN
ncbi:hypothetical protein CKA34_21170 (plasmid) [Rhizobium sp. 11515TR]|nr:hypothetical protein CKA34_21170 [Rhizobium sp. 11515TR]